MTKKKSGVVIFDPQDYRKYMTNAELREEKELFELSQRIKAEKEAKKQEEQTKKKKKAIRLAKEAQSKEDCYLRLAPAYDSPWRPQRSSKAACDCTVAPDYDGREDAMYELACSYN